MNDISPTGYIVGTILLLLLAIWLLGKCGGSGGSGGGSSFDFDFDGDD